MMAIISVAIGGCDIRLIDKDLYQAHFDPAGYRLLGKLYAELMLSLQGN